MARDYIPFTCAKVPFGEGCTIDVNLTSATHAHVSATTNGQTSPRLTIDGRLLYVSAHFYLKDGVWDANDLHISPEPPSGRGPKSLYGKVLAALTRAVVDVTSGEEGIKRRAAAQAREANNLAARLEEEKDKLETRLTAIKAQLKHLDKAIKAGKEGRILDLGESNG